jgi:hypothetical protein
LAHDLLDGYAVLRQSQDNRIGLLAAQIALKLEALGRGEQFGIDCRRPDYAADCSPSDTIGLALLTANTRVFSFDWPMRKIGQPLLRFVQLNCVVAGAAPTAGALTADVTLGDDAPPIPCSNTAATTAWHPTRHLARLRSSASR